MIGIKAVDALLKRFMEMEKKRLLGLIEIMTVMFVILFMNSVISLEKGSMDIFLILFSGFGVLIAILTLVISLVARRSKKVETLKNSLTNAFRGSLDSSSFNPKVKKGKSDD